MRRAEMHDLQSSKPGANDAAGAGTVRGVAAGCATLSRSPRPMTTITHQSALISTQSRRRIKQGICTTRQWVVRLAPAQLYLPCRCPPDIFRHSNCALVPGSRFSSVDATSISPQLGLLILFLRPALNSSSNPAIAQTFGFSIMHG